MKFGVCYDINKAIVDCPVNTDYIEVWGRDIWAMDEADFEVLCHAAKEKGVKAYSCCRLIDPSFRLTGEGVDLPAIEAYCDKLFYRLSKLGVTMLVFGSAKAKNVPEGFPREQAWEQLFAIGRMLAEKAAPYGQTVVVEPLRYKEVNIVNTVEEAAFYVRQVNRENFRVLVDFFHFDSNEEPWESLKKYGDLIVHAHFATAKTRTVPHGQEDWDFFERCMQALREIDYRGGVSFEGGVYDSVVLDGMLAQMKALDVK